MVEISPSNKPNKLVVPDNRPVPRHDPTHFQLPVEAVKVYLDLAACIMSVNEGINQEDWVWYEKYLTTLLEEVRQHSPKGDQ